MVLVLLLLCLSKFGHFNSTEKKSQVLLSKYDCDGRVSIYFWQCYLFLGLGLTYSDCVLTKDTYSSLTGHKAVLITIHYRYS